MKKDLHPNYHKVKVVCACGATFVTRSTYNGDVMKVDICRQCHPHYTGNRKVVDTAGRVEQFKKKFKLQ